MCVMPPRYPSLVGFIRFRPNLRMALIPSGIPFRKDSFRVPSSMTSETRSIINDPCQWLSLHIIRTCVSKKALPTEGPTAPLAWEGSVLVILTRSPTLHGRVVEYFFLLDNDCLRFSSPFFHSFPPSHSALSISGVFKRAYYGLKRNKKGRKMGVTSRFMKMTRWIVCKCIHTRTYTYFRSV